MREEGHHRLAQKKVANLGRELDFDGACQLVLQAVCQETDSQLTLLNTGLIMKTAGSTSDHGRPSRKPLPIRCGWHV